MNKEQTKYFLDVTFDSSILIYLLLLLTIRGHGDNFIITGIFIFITFIYSIFISISYKKFNFKFYNYKVWLLLLIWGLYITSKSPYKTGGLVYYLGTILVPFLIFSIITNIEINETFLRRFFKTLFFVGFIIGLGSILIFFTIDYSAKARLTSFWEGFNMVSAYLMIIFMFNLSFIINRKASDSFFLQIISLFVILFGLFLTQTRGVWLATVISIVIYIIKKPKVIIPSFILIGIFVYFFGSIIGTRVISIFNFMQDVSAIGRIQAWISSLVLIKNNFWLGYGFDSYLELRDNVYSFYIVKVIHSHNTYLRTMLEMGFIGFVLYFSFFFKAIYYVFFNKDDSFKIKYKKYFDGFQLSFIGLIIIFNFEPYFSLFDNSTVVMWILISLSFAFNNMSKVKKKYIETN